MLPSTVERVPRRTAVRINEQIRRGTEQDVAACAAAGGRPLAISMARLHWGAGPQFAS